MIDLYFCQSNKGYLRMTYENAENDVRRKCRKCKNVLYTKMPKAENSFSQKCRKSFSLRFSQ